jgi:hypothetical protein
MGRWRTALFAGLLVLATAPAQAGWYGFIFLATAPLDPADVHLPLDTILGEIRTDATDAVTSIIGTSKLNGSIVGLAAPAFFPGRLPTDGTPLQFGYANGRVTSLSYRSVFQANEVTCDTAGACTATYGLFGVMSLPPLPAVPAPGAVGLFGFGLVGLALAGLRRSARAHPACSGPPHPAGCGRAA